MLKIKWPTFGKSTAYSSASLPALLSAVFGGGATKSGASVTPETALQVTAVLGCVRVLSEGVAQVPFKLMRSDGRNRLEAREHRLYDVLHRRPNAWMTSFEFRETMMIHAALCGRGYAFINRVGSGNEVAELIPLEPANVRPIRAADCTLTYAVRGPNGGERIFPAESIWHWRGPSWNGYEGMNITRLAREAIGISMAAEQMHAKLYANGVKPQGLYSVEGTLSPQQYKDLRRWLDDEYGGAENAAKLMILDRNAKFTPTTFSGVDAQHLETRRFQIEEACRPYRVMPIMIGYSDKAATYASAEQMFLAHVVHTLAPWYERIEQSADINLLTDKERAAGYYAKFVTAGLLRGALKDTAEYLGKLVQGGIMVRNEAREKLDLNPIDGLDEPLTPANMNVGQPAEDEKTGVS